MPISLDRLSFDVIFHIAHFLDVEELSCLGASCRYFRLLTKGEAICRQAIEVRLRSIEKASAKTFLRRMLLSLRKQHMHGVAAVSMLMRFFGYLRGVRRLRLSGLDLAALSRRRQSSYTSKARSVTFKGSRSGFWIFMNPHNPRPCCPYRRSCNVQRSSSTRTPT